ncbi:DUF4350 domain-containing protein [Lusitaniella coriacea]|uniref:DUF4350 domain-containing protein n=1 Tax=Lusitaniella coriacea TaxID=1983105 RepID=UPI003CF7BDEA
MKLSKRRLILLGAIALIAIIFITLIAAPSRGGRSNSGSTYSRAPNGYGAWYASIKNRGTPIQRWQKPFENLAKSQKQTINNTFLRVNSTLQPLSLSSQERQWVTQGNTLILLGIRQRVTEAPFSSRQESPVGSVKIDTARRAEEGQKTLLGDRFGAVVWLEPIGKGQILYATTPHLAANAYQDYPGNAEFLTLLVTQEEPQETLSIQFPSNVLVEPSQQPFPFESSGGIAGVPLIDTQTTHQIWVDEYSHGYKDSEDIEGETQGNLLNYWAKTPLLTAFIQGLILLLVALWGGNHRFGQPKTLSSPTPNNSQAYIEGLAGVLHKAESSEFILEVLGKEEQLQLQQALGLGKIPLEPKQLLAAWKAQTGKSPQELQQVLRVQQQERRLKETELLVWLQKWQKIRSRT